MRCNKKLYKFILKFNTIGLIIKLFHGISVTRVIQNGDVPSKFRLTFYSEKDKFLFIKYTANLGNCCEPETNILVSKCIMTYYKKIAFKCVLEIPFPELFLNLPKKCTDLFKKVLFKKKMFLHAK